jgi:hypothetical protein
VQAGWDDPGGGGEPGDPYELTMNSVSLSKKHQPFGMDETRKKNQRKLFWYWQWSRDWKWREVVTVSSIQPEKAPSDEFHDEDENIRAWVWYWRWKDMQNAKKNKGKKRKVVVEGPPEYSPVVKWIISLNRQKH